MNDLGKRNNTTGKSRVPSLKFQISNFRFQIQILVHGTVGFAPGLKATAR